MKYFVDETERKASGSTCYLEWQKGYHHDECWLSDSTFISRSLHLLSEAKDGAEWRRKHRV